MLYAFKALEFFVFDSPIWLWPILSRRDETRQNARDKKL